MHSRVAAVKAPRTHNRRRVTGSSGRRREGRESEPQRPNISRRVFAFAVLLFLVVLMCCGTFGATPAKDNDGKNDLRSVQEPERVDLFFPREKVLQLRDEVVSGTSRDSFVLPFLVRAGGVVAAFAEGHIWMPDIKVAN
ncbi:trans-sialidase [Trypanosoma cruzi]|nr:trans-sialidase [Trypanosoma cruzi]